MSRWHQHDPEKAAIDDGADTKRPIVPGRYSAKSIGLFRSFGHRLGLPKYNFPSSFFDRPIRSKPYRIILLCMIAFVIFRTFFDVSEEDILGYIDPLIGSQGSGHVFAGATLPFGMAKPVADVTGEKMAGFGLDGSPVVGFSSLHDSGSGALASMGNFPIFLQPSCPDIKACSMTRNSRPQHYLPSSVNASPGYFGLILESGVRAEMTAAQRSSLFRFSFNEEIDLRNPVLVMDGSDLPEAGGSRLLQLDVEKGRMTAEGTFRPSFGQGLYRSYQCVDFREATIKDFGIFNNSVVLPGLTSTDGSINRFYAREQGVYVRFEDLTDNDKIHVRVGLSWLSVDRACENAEREIPDFDFDRVFKRAQTVWRDKLKPISIDSKGVDKHHLRNFWSGAYRAFLSPQDYTGENQLWKSHEPYYDSWYCIWDTFRGVHPFYMLVDTVSQSRMVRSLIDIYKHVGWLPDCRMSFCKGYTQGGSNADVVIVDSYLKGLGGVDWMEAYEAIIKDAEIQPPNWNIEGRGGLQSWKNLGFIPYLDEDIGGVRTRSISRTVEYAYNDFCIAEMANATDQLEDFAKYSQRASNWKNVFNPAHESMGFKGFPQPRWANGSFDVQDATQCSPLNDPNGCYLQLRGHETYEGSPWLYLFYTPGDMQGLIDLLGGREAFIQRLDTLHESGVLDMGNEQTFLTTFLYHYAGRPGLSANRVHQYIPRLFNDTTGGIPGNDDSGAMGTLVVFSMMGIIPVAGQNVYLITPPFFPSVSITNPQTGKKATMSVVNFDPSYKRLYIQSAKLNGRPYTKNWLDHGFFLHGGKLVLTLGEAESNWGTEQSDVPPSLSTGLYLG